MIKGRCNLFQVFHPCSRSKGRKSKDGSLKRGLNSKIHLAVDGRGMPVRIIVTEGTTVDCTQAESLITGLKSLQETPFSRECIFENKTVERYSYKIC
jgi:hypothetical protein